MRFYTAQRMHTCAVLDVRWRYIAGRQLRVVSTDLLFTGCRLCVSELVRYASLRSPVSGAGVSCGTDHWLSSRPSATPPSPIPPLLSTLVRTARLENPHGTAPTDLLRTVNRS